MQIHAKPAVFVPSNDSRAGKQMLKQSLLDQLQGSLVVSCQAPDGDPFRDAASMARFAAAANLGGAAAIRANGPADIIAVRNACPLPVFGIQKRMQRDGKLLITPSFEDACSLVDAGAAVVAVECTARAQRFGALELIRRIRANLQVPVMADIATIEEALAAEDAGADLVASTMRGYTAETDSVCVFEPAFIAELVRRLNVPVLAEGRVNTPEQAVQALAAGAHAIIVGTAITRPQAITSRFVAALTSHRATHTRQSHQPAVVAIDLGGTHTKAGLINKHGKLCHKFTIPTPVAGGRDGLLRHLVDMAKLALDKSDLDGDRVEAVGIATAGWVDTATGQIIHATENLPGWAGTQVALALEKSLTLPVAVENDANALAVAERHFGACRGVDDFACITLGTGVGGGCYSGGRLLRGAHFLGSAVGHIVIDRTGEICSCGKRGCLETFTNAAALLRYAGHEFVSAEAVIAAAHTGHTTARAALRIYAQHLTTGLASIVHLLDPTMIIVAGGISTGNTILFEDLNELLPLHILAASRRQIRIAPSPLGYYGALYGAAALAREKVKADTQ